MDAGASSEPIEPPADQPAALLTALTTEQFVLQSAASTTVSESVGRASIYLSALSASLVAIGFVADKPGLLGPFLAIILPTVFVLGIFTVVRLVDTGVQNVETLAQIARIRTYYATLSSEATRYFPAQITGAVADEALASMGLKPGPLLGLFTTASMIAVVDAAVGGTGVTLLINAATNLPLWPAVLAGTLVFLGGMTAFLGYQNSRYEAIRRPPP